MRVRPLAEGQKLRRVPEGVQDRFNKSLSMSDEVSSLAGDRVVSHERSRPADLPRRHRLCSRHAGSYPSHYCGCFPRCALLAYGHRCRNAVTVDGACKRMQSIASDKTSSFSAAACASSGFRKWATRVDHTDRCAVSPTIRTILIGNGPTAGATRMALRRSWQRFGLICPKQSGAKRKCGLPVN